MFIKADSIPDHHQMSNMTILMIQEFSWKMWCNMDFSSYPIDQQVCDQKVFIWVCVSNKTVMPTGLPLQNIRREFSANRNIGWPFIRWIVALAKQNSVIIWDERNPARFFEPWLRCVFVLSEERNIYFGLWNQNEKKN